MKCDRIYTILDNIIVIELSGEIIQPPDRRKVIIKIFSRIYIHVYVESDNSSVMFTILVLDDRNRQN